ncbi:MFS transporter [Nonomuraea sp. PA05]|uniref:MFS transporter n=1 Tax=Nonomuraea sp. PA05 TaxID=2604466 RepID=UPI001652907C|nr:MFS transporter [Nonomuraea sp. PA05]
MPSPTPRSMIRPGRRLSLPPLALLITGQALSGLGDRFFVVALPAILLQRYGTGTLALVLTVYGAARLAGLFLGGPFADRFPPRQIMLTADVARAVVIGVLCLLAWTGRAGVWELCAATAILGLASGTFLPASFSIIPAIVDESRIQRATSLNYATTQAVALGGPVIAGVAVARFGAGPALAVDAISYLVSVVTLWLMRRPANDAMAPAARAAGLRGVMRELPLLKVIMTLAAVGNIGFAGVLEVGLPALLHQTVAPFAAAYGIVLGAFGLGALLGSLLVGARPTPRNPVRLAVALLLPQAVMLAAAGLTAGATLTTLLFLGVGFTNAAANVLLMAVVQTAVPAEVRGRVFAALLVASIGFFPVGALLAGLLASATGPRAVFLLAAALVAVTSLAGLMSRPVRFFSRGGEPHAVRD